MEKRIEVAAFSSGDRLCRQGNCLVLLFGGQRRVISTSVYNGGYREDLKAVFNLDMSREPGGREAVSAQTYEAQLTDVSRRLGLDPDRTTGMGTAAHMEYAAIETLSHEELTVTAIATGGVESNGGRAGDPARFFLAAEKPPHGTINIMLLLEADMAPGTLTRALVTCTEAKTAALQELMADSRYSNGLATGSGTDQTVIVANAQAPLYLDDAGKHSKLGELIGRTVLAAVKQAMANQHGLTPARQHDLMRRLRRFGVTEETVWDEYRRGGGTGDKEPFLRALAAVAATPPFFTSGILCVHLYDEFLWGLLSEEEAREAAAAVLRDLADRAGIAPPLDRRMDETYMRVMEPLLAAAAARQPGLAPGRGR